MKSPWRCLCSIVMRHNVKSLIVWFATESLRCLSCFFWIFSSSFVFLIIIFQLWPNIDLADFAENFHCHCLERPVYDINEGVLDYYNNNSSHFKLNAVLTPTSLWMLTVWKVFAPKVYVTLRLLLTRSKMQHFDAFNLIT